MTRDPLSSARRRPPDPVPVWKTVGLVLLAVGLLVGAVALYRVLDPRDSRDATRAAHSGRPRTLGLSGLAYDPATRMITGRVRNYTETPYDNVAVAFDLLDAAHAVVGAIRDSASVIAPGGTWNFHIQVPAPNVTKVRLVGYAATRRDGPRTNVDVTQDV